MTDQKKKSSSSNGSPSISLSSCPKYALLPGSTCTDAQTFAQIYGFTPDYQLRTVNGSFSKCLFLCTVIITLLYIIFSAHDFLYSPPELLQQSEFFITSDQTFPVTFFGLEILYSVLDPETGEMERRFVNASNTDRYFTWAIEHQTVNHQDTQPRTIRPVDDAMVSCDYNKGFSCIGEEQRKDLNIQGEWLSPSFQFLNIRINRCVNTTTAGVPCVTVDEIMEVIDSPTSVEMSLLLKSETFDSDQYQETGNGVKDSISTWRWFPKLGVSLQHEVYMQSTRVQMDGRWFGSYLRSLFGWTGAFQSDTVEFLHLKNIVTHERPQGLNVREQYEYMEFFIRMDRLGVNSVLTYENNSIFELLALWGAFFNFLAVFTIGALARKANSHLFNKSFRESLAKTLGPSEREDESESSQEIAGRMGFLRHLSFRMNRSSKTQRKDALLSEIRYPLDKMDIRLMDAENFDETGRLVISKEELYHPSSVFGELRLMALREHSRKREAARKISSFYHERRDKKDVRGPNCFWSTTTMNITEDSFNSAES